MKHDPFDAESYEIRMNTHAGVRALIEVDERYREEIRERRDRAALDDGYYVVCPPAAMPLAWAALELLLPQMADLYPDCFGLACEERQWTWTNAMTRERSVFVIGEQETLARPLHWLGCQVQEDLALLAPRADGEMTLVAGHLCFGSQWCLPDKLAQTFEEIHAPVPTLNSRIGRSASALLRQLKPGRPVERLNWTISPTNRLDLSTRSTPEWVASRRQVTAENAGHRCYLRIERQTLSALLDGVLFTIHTYLHPLAEVAEDADRLRRMYLMLRSMSEPTIVYKGMADYFEPMVRWIEKALRSAIKVYEVIDRGPEGP